MSEHLAAWAPDRLARFAIRRRLAAVLAENNPPLSDDTTEKTENTGTHSHDVEARQRQKQRIVARLGDASTPICALDSEPAANKQHYEVPTEFFQRVMGQYMKYSCCYYPRGASPSTMSLSDAEEAMLNLVCERANLTVDSNGENLTVLDLGCGWGSFTLYAARRFPSYRFFALSNSQTQRAYIERKAVEDGTADRITVVTANISEFEGDGSDAAAPSTQSFAHLFDRIVSNEMFEHMKNYRKLLAKLSRWLKPTGTLFIHHFAHKDTTYDFKDGDWMADNFFTGGTMPSADLMLYFQEDLVVKEHYAVNGRHYEHTSNAWLMNMDKAANRAAIADVMKKTYGADAALWTTRWRLFFLACAELFGYNSGNEWYVVHVVMGHRQ